MAPKRRVSDVVVTEEMLFDENLDLHELTVVQLKSLCDVAGAAKSGNKDALVSRLLEYRAEKSKQKTGIGRIIDFRHGVVDAAPAPAPENEMAVEQPAVDTTYDLNCCILYNSAKDVAVAAEVKPVEAEQPEPVVELPKPDVEQPEPVVELPKPVLEQSIPAVEQSKPVEQTKPIEQPKPVEPSKPAVEQPKPESKTTKQTERKSSDAMEVEKSRDKEHEHHHHRHHERDADRKREHTGI